MRSEAAAIALRVVGAILLWLLATQTVRAEDSSGKSTRLQDIGANPPPGESWTELSGLLAMGNDAHLDKGWVAGYWAVLDEPPVEEALVRLGCRTGPSSSSLNWELRRTEVSPIGPAVATTDCEAIARRGSTVYIFGSHFGKKRGPLDARRQFVARFEETPTTSTVFSEGSIHAPAIRLEVAADRFLLHRLINDALTSWGVELMGRGSREADGYVDATVRAEPASASHIRSKDRAINIEGAVFLRSGMVLLGLRYPVTRQGHPIIVGLSDIDRLFAGGEPSVRNVWTLENAGDARTPTGIRELSNRHDKIDVLTGNLDRFSNKKGESLVLEDHPEGTRASSRHYCLPALLFEAGENALRAELVRDLAPHSNVEALAIGPNGDYCYGLDESSIRLLVKPDR